jgi:hypothetical protein
MSLDDLLAALSRSLLVQLLFEDPMIHHRVEAIHDFSVFDARKASDISKDFDLVFVDSQIQILDILLSIK